MSELSIITPQNVDPIDCSSSTNPDEGDFSGLRRRVIFNRTALAILQSVFTGAILFAADSVAALSCLAAPGAIVFIASASRQQQPHALRWHDAAGGAPNLPFFVPESFTSFAAVGCLLFAFLLCGHYTRRLKFWTEARQVIEAAAVVGFLTIELHVPYRNGPPKILTALAWALLPAVVLGARTIARRLLARTRFSQVPVVIVGDRCGIDDALAILASQALPQFRAVEFLPIDAWSADRPAEQWASVLRRSGAERIMLAAPLDCQRDWDVVRSIVEQRVPLSIFSGLGGLPVSAADSFCIQGHDRALLNFCNRLAQPSARLLKGMFDFIVSGVMLLLLLPLFAAIAVAVSMDGGPVFYAQTRIGRSGRTFRCLKFRSMSVRADQILHDYLASNADAAREWELQHKLKHDPRVTQVGRVLRITSLDELPQLLNVLRMDMSLVGPRPIIRAEESRYGGKINFYCETRPGLTGLWQVSGRSTTSYSRRVQLDAWYVSNWSIWLDITILVKTLFVVLSRRGAY